MRHRPSKLICRIEVSGFLAILLFFFFLFAIPAAVSHPGGVFVDMPKVDHSISLLGASRDDALVITVLRDGQLFFGPEIVSLDELTNKLRERTKGHKPRTVYIKVDVRC